MRLACPRLSINSASSRSTSSLARASGDYAHALADIERAIRIEPRNPYHWFDGDGLVQHFQIGRTGVTHAARFVQTEKYEEEQAAGKFLYGGAGTSLPGGLPIT